MFLFCAIAIFCFGLLFGSFLNVCIHRIPREESIVWPGSACPDCKSPIHFYDNVPVFSWLVLRGRCRNCKAPISPRYLLVELFTGVLFLLCFLEFGLSMSTLKYCVFSFLIIGLVFIDAEWKLLPNKLTLTGLVVGLGFSLFVPVNDFLGQIMPSFMYSSLGGNSWRLVSLMDSALGALVGASFIYGVGEIYLRARGVEGMGFGDVKLMAMVGSFLGVRLTVITLFGASLVGSLFGLAMILNVWRKRTRRRVVRNHEPLAVARKRAWQSASMVYRFYQIPFGVFLGSMALFSLFFGNALLRGYWGLFL
jgi:leader peptidase (prepilin peptidase) / N-methyltransferase